MTKHKQVKANQRHKRVVKELHISQHIPNPLGSVDKVLAMRQPVKEPNG